ncbi:MAG: tRNA (adenosine(37)-N6)-dimethylallyltransferase MiaA [Oscillospiraceae bacterium]|nr:tRNA (adenosine(37)-N6)-dimethylallyltransferase MiaA [Oscillospiraceae bacterium]
MKKIPVIAVVGPTASGKTALAVKIAQRFNGQVVSADSMQIYKGMDIATAKPTEEEMGGIRHHLIDFLPTDVRFSVADYVSAAQKCISQINKDGFIAVVAGGTGLYIDSLLQNVSFCVQKTDDSVRLRIAEEYETLGGEELLLRLQKVDPETANRIHPSDKSRIVRALSLFESTGTTITEQYNNSRLSPSPYEVLYIGINYRDRELLYSRINGRVDKMLQNGLLEEAKSYFDLSKNTTASQAIGHKELAPFFKGEKTLDECIENLKRETRRYAKRQLTWFRRNENINWIYPDDYQNADEAVNIALGIAENFLRSCDNGQFET